MIEPVLVDALARAGRSPVLLVAADYDGTLAPIVDDPAAARPHRPALDALSNLAALPDVHCVIVSGRSLATLRALTGSPEGVRLIGTHGLEEAATNLDPDTDPLVGEVTQGLHDVASSHSGTQVEPKPRGAALHYRHATDPRSAAEAAREVGTRPGVRVMEGKKVIELIVGEGDKGSAVARVRSEVGASSVVFLGDDVTDEDVFVTLGPDDVGVKVGSGETRARFRITGPAEVAAALQHLRSHRPAAG